MAPKVKATAQLHQEAPRKAQKRAANKTTSAAPSEVERLLQFLANTADFPSQSFGEDVRGMLQRGVAIGCAAETEHQYVRDVENMVEDVLRDARQAASNSLADADDRMRTMHDEIQSLKSSRESLAEAAVGTRADFATKREAHKDKRAVVAQAEVEQGITAQALAASCEAQQCLLQEKSSVEEAIRGSFHALVDGLPNTDTSKSKHVKTVVQLLKDVGAEPSLVASVPGALSVAAADRTQWHNITIHAVKQLFEEVVVELDGRVDAAAQHFQSSEAEDMGSAALIERFTSQMLEACAQRDMAQEAADAADARLLEMDERLSELAVKSSALTCEQTLFRNKVHEVDALLSSLEYVRGRHERRAAEEEEAKVKAEAMAQAAVAAAAAMSIVEDSALPEIEDTKAPLEAMLDFDAKIVGAVQGLNCGDGKLHSEPAVVCRVALGA